MIITDTMQALTKLRNSAFFKFCCTSAHSAVTGPLNLLGTLKMGKGAHAASPSPFLTKVPAFVSFENVLKIVLACHPLDPHFLLGTTKGGQPPSTHHSDF